MTLIAYMALILADQAGSTPYTTFFVALISTLLGGGLTAAILNVWKDLKLKKIDIAFNERKEFIKEVADLRQSMQTLYRQHLEMMSENSDLKRKVKELEDHVRNKSLLLTELAKYRAMSEQLVIIVDEYCEEDVLVFVEKIKNLVADVPGSER